MNTLSQDENCERVASPFVFKSHKINTLVQDENRERVATPGPEEPKYTDEHPNQTPITKRRSPNFSEEEDFFILEVLSFLMIGTCEIWRELGGDCKIW